MSLEEFKYGWTNALGEDEAEQLYETYHVAAPGVALLQQANANLNPFTRRSSTPGTPNGGRC